MEDKDRAGAQEEDLEEDEEEIAFDEWGGETEDEEEGEDDREDEEREEDILERSMPSVRRYACLQANSSSQTEVHLYFSYHHVDPSLDEL